MANRAAAELTSYITAPLAEMVSGRPVVAVSRPSVRSLHRSEQEGLAVASIAQRNMLLFRLPLPATTMRGKFGSEFEA